MKQIIPFKKELLFKTKVSEITSISLEHNLSLRSDDLISGEFIITGDYKMTEGSINREKFSFTLPFDIALDSRYDAGSIIIDIDNFYYEVVNNEFLLVNIDVFVDGEKVLEEVVDDNDEDDVPVIRMIPNDKVEVKEQLLEGDDVWERGEYNLNIDYEKKKYVDLDEDEVVDLGVEDEFNIFKDIDNSDTYVTYHVYIVKEGDTIDTIMEKYGVKKESLILYNDIENIRVGTKLIIPYES